MSRSLSGYFSKAELILWFCSVLAIVVSFLCYDGKNTLVLLASLVGVTSLIFTAKGHLFGQVLVIVFSIMYGVISYSFAYYGEMLTYLGMTMPMAVFALISWARNPFGGKRTEVKVNRISAGEWILMTIVAAVVTLVFYFVLVLFHTSNIIPSTISVTTSFVAVYLTFRRSAWYAAGYAANDVVLIVLWSLAAIDDPSYISVVVCFAAFLANDVYGFINWRKMGKRQAAAE